MTPSPDTPSPAPSPPDLTPLVQPTWSFTDLVDAWTEWAKGLRARANATQDSMGALSLLGTAKGIESCARQLDQLAGERHMITWLRRDSLHWQAACSCRQWSSHLQIRQADAVTEHRRHRHEVMPS